MDIRDKNGNIVLSIDINEGSIKKVTLMKEDYITLKFSLSNPIYFHLGDYVQDDSIGIYELTDLYKPSYNESTDAYDYELKLDAYYYAWKNKIFKYTPSVLGREANWNLTATLDIHLDVFLANLKAYGYKYNGTDFTYSIDFITTSNPNGTVKNIAKYITYSSMNMIDALTEMANKWVS